MGLEPAYDRILRRHDEIGAQFERFEFPCRRVVGEDAASLDPGKQCRQPLVPRSRDMGQRPGLDPLGNDLPHILWRACASRRGLLDDAAIAEFKARLT